MDEKLFEVLRDPARLRTLADAELMDSPQEERFDQYTRLACQLLRAPAALMSLVDDHRQFFKSMHGMGDPGSAVRETPLSHSFCKYAVASGEPLIIDDAPQHPLVHDSPAVKELGVRAYAGVPLHAEGQGLGVLCVVDTQPRHWSDDELAILRVLASAVTAEIELTLARREARDCRTLLDAITGSAMDSIITMNGAGDIVFANEAVQRTFKRTREQLQGQPVTVIMPERYRAAHRDGLARVEGGGEPRVIGRVLQLHGLRADGEEFPLELSVSRWLGRSGAFYTAVLRDVTERQRALTALQEAEEQLRLTIDNAPIGIALVRPDGRWLRVNEALCRIVGYAQDELLALDFQTVTHPDDLQADLDHARRLLAGENSRYTLEKRFIHRDGRVVYTLLAVSLVRKADGSPSFFVSQIQDISDRVESERKSSEQAAILRAVLQSMGDVVMVCDQRGRIIVINDMARRLFGPFMETAMQGRWEPGRGFFAADKVSLLAPSELPLARATRGETVEQSELWVHMPGWTAGRWHSTTGNPVRGADGKLLGAVIVARDVTARKELEEQVRQTSLIDELTGLHNRRGFILLGEQLLKTASRYDRAVFVLFADLNGLKLINDQLGHEMGDQAIIDMGAVLRATFRKSDVLARLGGDEFVVLAEGDRRVATTATTRLENAVATHNASAGRPYGLSASVGVAHYDQVQASGLAELISAADKLMYDAKRRIKGSEPLR